MKLLVMFIAAALSIPALSDNHSPENPYLGFYYFSAPNAEAVVTAMDTFYESDCGKQYPADVALAEQVFEPLGLQVRRLARVPYLSRGGPHGSILALNDALFVLARGEA